MKILSTKDEVQAYYDSKSEDYDEVFDTLYFRIFDVITWKYLEPYLPKNSDALILDAGGGTGRWAIKMAKQGCRVVLMDASEKMLEVAARRTERQHLQDKVTIRKGDITTIGYDDETFDLVLCEHTLFLFQNPDDPLREFNRVLKKKARLIVSVHNHYVAALARLSENPSSDNVDTAFKTLTREKHSCMTKGDSVKVYTWTPAEFREMLERNGFHMEKMIGKGMTMPLRISKDMFMKRKYSKDLYEKLLQFELTMCEKQDALALAGHLQAIAHKL
jgi:ubiquinone/menaquinone biosynthesis C-methylase UbiE